MKRYSLVHLSDDVLLRELAAVVSRERSATADLLAHIAEVDARKLYRPAAYPSMFAYCVGELHLSDDAAAKRIQAARAARRFPAIFEALATGRLHLSGVCLLAPHFTEDTAAELLAAATHKTRQEIERLLAERYPRPDLPSLVQAIAAVSSGSSEHAPGHVGEMQLVVPQEPGSPEHAPGHVQQEARAPFVPPPPPERSRVKPLAPQRYGVQFTMSQSAHDKLRYVQDLLGHQVASGDLAAVFEGALDAWIPVLERRKFAATEKPRRRGVPRSAEGSRHVPARVRCAVWKRDQGRCTFVSESGHRCEATRSLQFDHVLERARGGEASVDNIRLRCSAHNQLTAERTFGADFMRHKRIAGAEARPRGA